MNKRDVLWISLINGVGSVSLSRIISISSKNKVGDISYSDLLDIFKIANNENKRIKIPTLENINAALIKAEKVIY